MALHPDIHSGGDGADDNKILRCWDEEKRFHLNSRRSLSCHIQEMSGWNIVTVPL